MDSARPNHGDPPIRILLTDTNRWALSARLAIGLSESGFQVSIICPAPGHPAQRMRAIGRVYRYRGLRPVESLRRAIEAANPDLIIPACDRSVGHLHRLCAEEKSRSGESSRIAALIERSIGPATSHSIVASRYELLAAAREEGVRIPRTCRIESSDDLARWSEQEPLPWVLKVDGSWGGGGVRILRAAEQAADAMAQLAHMFRAGRAVKRLIVNRDSFWLGSLRQPSQHSVIAQSCIKGRPANCAVVAWQGRVLAMIAVDVAQSDGLTGPACAVRITDNADMRSAAEKIAARLQLSGFFGLDFMIEEGTEAAHLIEMNPRATPPCHVALGRGRDLPAALRAAISGDAVAERPAVTTNSLIAYFPPAPIIPAEMLRECFVDTPIDEPALVKELKDPFPNRTFLYRLLHRITTPARPAEPMRPNRVWTGTAGGAGRSEDEAVAPAPQLGETRPRSI